MSFTYAFVEKTSGNIKQEPPWWHLNYVNLTQLSSLEIEIDLGLLNINLFCFQAFFAKPFLICFNETRYYWSD